MRYSISKWPFKLVTHCCVGAAVFMAACVAHAQTTAPAAAGKPGRSSLPDDALKQAQEAERQLAAANPKKAIEILQQLDQTYPGNSALSLRLAEVHDANNDYGPSLFYYRRYIKLAGSRAREIPVARVSTLELMAGVDKQASDFARKLGEATVPVATPTPQIERSLEAQAKDGSRVPVTSAEQLEEIHRRGYVPASPSPRPTVTPAARAIVLPDTTRTPAANTAASASHPREPEPAPGSASESLPVSQPHSTPSSRKPVASPKVSIAPPASKPDEDNLFAEAFVKAGTDSGSVTVSAPNAQPESVESQLANEPIPEVRRGTAVAPPPPPPALDIQEKRSTPAAGRQQRPVSVAPEQAPIAYTQATPATNSPRAANFFNVSIVQSNNASVVIINDLPTAIVTLSLVPQDDSNVISAILAPGETKTLVVRPGTYDVTARASSNDYSPVTLMSTQFEHRFVTGRQYTRRFNQTSLQQLN